MSALLIGVGGAARGSEPAPPPTPASTPPATPAVTVTPPSTSAPSSPSASTPDIIVSTPRGRTSGGIDPLLSVSPSELDSYGVDTLNDLVDALRPLTRSSRSDQMAVVLINGHLAGQTEFDNLPREAIERVDVLPERVALQYGFSENQRVLNFILREHYRAAPVRVTDSGATEGGSQVFSTDAVFVSLEDEARVSLLSSYKDSAWLRDSDRHIAAPDNYFLTLQPDTSDAKIAGTVSRAIAGVSASLEASLDVLSTKSLQGVAESSALSPGGTLSSGVLPLLDETPTRTARIATQWTGQVQDFLWGATASYLHIRSRSSSDTGLDDEGAALVDRADSAFNAGNLQLSLSGRVARLPAGLLIANAKFAFQYQGFEARDQYPGSLAQVSNLVRTVRTGSFNANIPIANRDRGVLPALGDLAATFNATLDTVSNFGALWSTSYGFDWRPLAKVHFDAIYTDHRTAPTLQQLRAPPVYAANEETYDYITGQTTYPTEITGGNGELQATDDRQDSIGLSLGPFLGKSEFLVHYEQNRIANAIGELPPTTAAVELAFPDRFIRDADGTLIEIDDRWVNLAAERVDDVKWGLNVWIPLGEPLPHVMPDRVEFSLFDTWYLHDVTLIRSGIAPLDLLNGAPSDVTGGQPRHKIEFHTLVHKNWFGVLLAAAWRSPTVVGSGDPAAPDFIDFSSLGTADLRLFADLARWPPARGAAWAKNARVALALTNVFDRRQTVHDAGGATPLAFQPGYLDPPGRTLALTLRKVF